MEGDGETVFAHACKMGSNVSCRTGMTRPTAQGRSRDWVKKKNPDASAATREAEEDWS